MVKIAEKRFYWIKLKDNFFTQPKIKKLRRLAGGDTYTIIYLKLLLLSLKNEGRIYYEGIEDDFISELSLILDENVDDINMTVLFMKQHGLIEEVNEDEYTLPEALANIGSETNKAVAMRKLRKKRSEEKLLKGNNVTDVLPVVTNGYIEKEIEIEKELDKEKDIYKEPLKRVSEKALQERFSALWSIYPRKQGKQNAFNSYKKAVKDGVTDEEIEKGIRDYLYYIEKTGTESRYIKQGSTWFNQRCWNDDYTVSAKKEEKDVLTRMMEEERAKSADNGLFDIFGFESSRQDDYIDVQYREKE